MQQTEEWLKKEAQIADSDANKLMPTDSDVQSVLSSYASDENPDEYSFAYSQLKTFIDTSLDAYKVCRFYNLKDIYEFVWNDCSFL